MRDEVRREHFVTMLGSCWDAARVAGFVMRLEFHDGSRRQGVPSVSASGPQAEGQELDDTGVARELELDGVPVDTRQVRSYTVLGLPALTLL